jgi:protein TonB
MKENHVMNIAYSAVKFLILAGIEFMFMFAPINAGASDKTTPVEATTEAAGNVRKICARPEYPEHELKQNHQGVTGLRFLIGADGYVKQALIHKSSGYPALDEAALVGLSKCRFKPLLADEKAVEGWLPIQYVWKP